MRFCSLPIRRRCDQGQQTHQISLHKCLYSTHWRTLNRSVHVFNEEEHLTSTYTECCNCMNRLVQSRHASLPLTRCLACAADGSVRVFDLRDKEHSTIIYESPQPETPLLRLGWNKQDPRYMATILMDSSKVVILDIRFPTLPVAELQVRPLVQ